jgi:drug/metabolite transporter (DMT)-like permease
MWARDEWRGAAYGLLAAASFGASAPIAKRLLAEAPPLVLAPLLYLGGGMALVLVRTFRPAPASREAGLGLADGPALAAIVLLGGFLGPVLMLVGLARVPGVTGSLLLNLEAPLTMLVAVASFREHLGRAELRAVACVLAGAVVLSGATFAPGGDPLGALALAAACLCWAVDNNLTQRLSLRDPFAVARGKTLGAALAGLAVALVVGQPAPGAGVAGIAVLVGAVSYGVSIVLDVYALRLIGAAREAAYFATAPFFGAALAVPLLGERFGASQAAAAAMMALGVVLLSRARHGHAHEHAPITHAHRHVHDVHHDHAHATPVEPGEAHSHEHTHAQLVHDHPHVSDAHHRHRH